MKEPSVSVISKPSAFMKQKLAKNLGYLDSSFIILLFYGSFISEPVLCFLENSGHEIKEPS
jgi:hypothetical protein